jgi:hypothetical protein
VKGEAKGGEAGAIVRSHGVADGTTASSPAVQGPRDTAEGPRRHRTWVGTVKKSSGAGMAPRMS